MPSKMWPRLARTAANDQVFRGFDPELTRLSPGRDPSMEMGSHPDVVERVMDKLGAALPSDCRFLADGRAVLAHPATGRILAMPYGMAYALWLPEEACVEAKRSGLIPTRRWSNGTTTDLEREIGPGWLFGAWHADEERWLRAAYDACVP